MLDETTPWQIETWQDPLSCCWVIECNGDRVYVRDSERFRDGDQTKEHISDQMQLAHVVWKQLNRGWQEDPDL